MLNRAIALVRKCNVVTHSLLDLIHMFSRICIITVFACIGLGMTSQFLRAGAPNPGKELLSTLRSYQSPSVKNEGNTNGPAATSNHRLAMSYANQNDVTKANTYFGLALQNATPKQIPVIASDYAAFLSNAGDLHRAELVLRRALTQSPNERELTRMLARCLVKQDKMVEGLRYLKTVGTEAEAREEIMAIHREQGNTDMLAAAERKWGTEGSTPIRHEPVLIASAPKPAMVSSPIPSVVRTLPPEPAIAVPREVAQKEVAPLAATPVPKSGLSKSEFFDTKVPVPVPHSSPQPMLTMVATQKRVPLVTAAPVPMLPAPIPSAKQPVYEKVVAAASGTQEPQKPAVAIQPRKHYVVNADASADLDTLFPVKAAAATMPLR